MPLPHIGVTRRNTRSMVHLELGLKTGTRVVTVRHRGKRRRGEESLDGQMKANAHLEPAVNMSGIGPLHNGMEAVAGRYDGAVGEGFAQGAERRHDGAAEERL